MPDVDLNDHLIAGSGESRNPHTVEVTIETGGWVRWAAKCDAEVGATCRMWCDEGCEVAGADHGDRHTLFDQGACGQIEFINADQAMIAELYSGPDAPLRSGRIDLHWDGDFYTWSYADEAGHG